MAKGQMSFQEEATMTAEPKAPKRLSMNDIKVPDILVLKLRRGISGKKRTMPVYIDGMDDIVDPNTGENRRLRLLRGETSIFEDEQRKTYTQDQVGVNRLSLDFTSERCVLGNSAEHRLMKKYAMVCNSNADNSHAIGSKKYLFEVWNPDKQASQEYELETLMIEAMQQATLMSEDKMKRHAIYLGIIETDETSQQPLSIKQIRTEYVRKAKQDPAKFLKSMDAEIVTISYLIHLAMGEAKIDTGKIEGQAYWANGGFICAFPQGADREKYLVEFAQLPREECINFVQQLKRLYENKVN